MKTIVAALLTFAMAAVLFTTAADAQKENPKGDHMLSGDMGKDMRMMNHMMVKHLGKKDADYEKRFIDMMIPHHEGAVMMAKNALQNANRPELKKMAEDIIQAQEKEIAQLKEWRQKWYGDK